MKLFISKMKNGNLFVQAGAYGKTYIGDIIQELSPDESIFNISYDEIIKIIEGKDYKGYIEIK